MIRPSVLMLAPFLSKRFSGTAHSAISIANALADRGRVRLNVATFAIDENVIPDSVECTMLAAPPDRRLLWRVARAFSISDHLSILRAAHLPRVGLMYTQSLDMALAYSQLFPGTRVITHLGHVIASREALTDTSLSSPWRSIDAMLVDRNEMRCYRLPNSTHLVSTQLVARQRGAHFGIDPAFFPVQPLGIDTVRFSDRSPRVDRRHALGLAADDCLIISVSRLVRWKNTDWLLRALEKLPAHCHLLLLGDGPERQALVTAVPRQLASRVHILGHTDPAPWLAAADIFALPSTIESFGIAYAEAMCMGLPCIGLRNMPPFSLSTAEDVLDPDRSGLVVSDEAELVTALHTLVSDRSRREQMGARAHQLAIRQYSRERYAEYLESLLDLPDGDADPETSGPSVEASVH